MTPNPNPSPELLPCPFCGGGAERYTASVGVGFENRQVQCRQCGASAFDAKWQVRATLSPQTLPAPGEVEGVCAQCKGMRDDLAGGRDPEELCDPCYDDAVLTLAALKPLATVAAANDEAFARGVEAAAKIADDYALGALEGGETLVEATAETIAAAFRLLSQGGGK